MLLLVDAGNSRVKWALIPCAALSEARAPGQWAASGVAGRAEVRQLADAWRDAGIARALLSNVAGPAMRGELEQALWGALGLKPVPLEWFASAPQCAGLRNGYRDPAQLGCDRFAAAIGARALYPDQPLIVATCGTATTIDAVSADGVFLGGMILPGPELMAASLAKNTAQLPHIAHGPVVTGPVAGSFADNTDAAIANGCIAAQAGAIERAVAAHGRAVEPGGSGGAVQCILSGGAAALVAPHLAVPHRKVDHLVLIGLETVARACAAVSDPASRASPIVSSC